MSREGGSVAILSLLMLLLLSAMGMTLLLLSNTALQIATNHKDGISAQYWTEAGMEYGVTKLKTNGEFVRQTGLEQYVIAADFPSTLSATGKYTVQIGPDSSRNPNLRVIVARGMVNNAKRQITAQITLPKPGEELRSLVIRSNEL